jgi:DNA-binding NtrC family response regulator
VARVFIDTSELETAVAVREAVQADGHEIEMVESVGEVESRLRDDEEIALALTGSPDRGVPRKLLAFFDERIPRPPVLGVVDGLERPTSAGERLVVDEVLSPPPDPEEVRVVLNQQLERFRVQIETGIVGRTRAVRDVLERLHLVAPVSSTVLLTGESGTGKELVARAVHRYSPRRGRSFIAVNCAALPESLLESELFGHEKGAFTGATSRRKGMFELADGGTIFLDEIAEMPSPLQTRLLRVLEQKRFMRVGGDAEIEVDVRVVAATNQDLTRAVQEGGFRRDLYYRLNVLQLELPPLRERRADIPVLIRRFIHEFTEEHDREFKGLTSEAMEILLRYDWPGNVRELRNLVESMVVLAPGSMIRAEDIPDEIRSGGGRSLLPVSARDRDERPPAAVEAGARRRDAELPEMEFIFRTLIELKMDVEDLRREFDRYREEHPDLVEGETRRRGEEIEIPALTGDAAGIAGGAGDGGAAGEQAGDGATAASAGDETGAAGGDVAEAGEADEEPVIEFRPGMSMSELEREAIVATLREVDGNRREAAEKLEIGERTLYRKLREYDIDL